MDERKKVLRMLFFGYVSIFVLLLFIIYLVGFRKPKGGEGTHSLFTQVSVQGTATITAVPDIANISFELSTKEVTAQKAKEANDAMLLKLNDVLAKYDIKEKELKMNYINIYPYYDNVAGRSTIVGYMARKTITVKIKEIEKYSSFIDDILKIGINSVHSVEFSLDDTKVAKNNARKKALEAAREKAELYASEVGKKIVNVVEISEDLSSMRYNPVANYRSNLKSAGRGMKEDMEDSFQEERGSISVEASISVIFAME